MATLEDKDETGIHLHCLSCYSLNCTAFENCCQIYCSNQCGIKYHACKETEHYFVCRRYKRACVNSGNGCPLVLDSVSMMSHLQYCPASVVHCGMSWNRYPIYSKIREEWLPFWQGNPVQVEGDLDSEFTISDQIQLNREMKLRMNRGVRHVPGSKKIIAKIPKDRIEELQKLLHSTHLKEKSNQINGNHNETGSGVLNDNSNYDDEDEFVTYDDLVKDITSQIATVVTSTNLRFDYFDLPSKYSEGNAHKFDIMTHDSDKTQPIIMSCDDLTAHDIELRNTCYNDLKLSYFPLGLNVVIETMPKFQNQYPMYSFSCSKVFRRDQYSDHCKNIHLDVQCHLNGWLLERCPLSQYGCPFTQYKFKPKQQTIHFSRTFASFYSKHDLDIDKECNKLNKQGNGDCDKNFSNQDRLVLTDLPQEVIEYLFTFLDNLSLNCIVKTCHYLKNICYDLLDSQGVVMTTWVKKDYGKLGASWKEEKQVRFFTTSCSLMSEFQMTNAPHIGQHLQTCVFNVKKKFLTDRVFLLGTDDLLETKVKPKVYNRPRGYDYQEDTDEDSDY